MIQTWKILLPLPLFFTISSNLIIFPGLKKVITNNSHQNDDLFKVQVALCGIHLNKCWTSEASRLYINTADDFHLEEKIERYFKLPRKAIKCTTATLIFHGLTDFVNQAVNRKSEPPTSISSSKDVWNREDSPDQGTNTDGCWCHQSYGS